MIRLAMSLRPLFLLFFLLAGQVLAQSAEDARRLVKEGIALHDQGDLSGAVVKYREAIAIDPNNLEATYELALTLSAQQKVAEALPYIERGTRVKSDYQPAFFEMYGNLLDLQGESKKAITAYKRGLRLAPNFASLHFNLGVASSAAGRLDEAREHLKRNIELRPAHPFGHLALAKVWEASGFRVPAILAYIRFLTFEEPGPRSEDAARMLLGLLNLGVTTPDNKTIEIKVDTKSKKAEGDFGALEMMLALAAGAQYLEDESKSSAERITAMLESALAMLSESADKKLEKTFTFRTYGPFVAEMQSSGHLPAFSNLTLSRIDVPGSKEWIAANGEKIEAYREWVRSKGREKPAAVVY
jgi:tetratricopeptide (TPR) repeat protein